MSGGRRRRWSDLPNEEQSSKATTDSTTDVFVLWHTHVHPDGVEDQKLLGVFSNEEAAASWLEEAGLLPGFKDCTDGFEIDSYAVDKRVWTGGFVTDTWLDPDPEDIDKIAKSAGLTRDDITMVNPDTGEVYGPSGRLLGNINEVD